jgi:pyrroloquinoline quinone biosynthesis protein D
MIDTDARLALPAWVRLRFDKVRNQWVLLAPERVLFPCPTSVEIIQRLDGAPTFGAIVDYLAAEYEAPRETMEADVAAMLEDLAGQGFLKVGAGADG